MSLDSELNLFIFVISIEILLRYKLILEVVWIDVIVNFQNLNRW